MCFLSLLCFLLHTSVCFLLLCVLFAACVLGADEPLFQPEMLTAVVSPLELCPKLVLCVVMVYWSWCIASIGHCCVGVFKLWDFLRVESGALPTTQNISVV